MLHPTLVTRVVEDREVIQEVHERRVGIGVAGYVISDDTNTAKVSASSTDKVAE